jgi:hypothetical protein
LWDSCGLLADNTWAGDEMGGLTWKRMFGWSVTVSTTPSRVVLLKGGPPVILDYQAVARNLLGDPRLTESEKLGVLPATCVFTNHAGIHSEGREPLRHVSPFPPSLCSLQSTNSSTLASCLSLSNFLKLSMLQFLPLQNEFSSHFILAHYI